MNPAASPPARHTGAIAPIIAGLMLSTFLVALDSTIVSTAMPSIVGNLGGFSLYAWVPSVYLLVTAVTTPIYGKLSDLFGRKRILFAGIGLFLLGSILSGAAPTMLTLILFRAIQGLGAGAVQPTTMTIIGDIFTLEQRAKYQGLFGSVWGISSVIGPLVGGLLVDNAGWRWVFYINVPIGLLAVGMLATYFHERPVHREHRIDIAGVSYLTFMLTSLLLFLIEGGQSWAWISVQSGVLILISVISLILFVRQESRAPEPAIPLDLFTQRIIAVSAVGAFFAGVVMIGISYEVPLFVQGVQGLDAVRAGFSLAPMSIGWPLASAFSARMAIRFGYRITATSGMLAVLVGVVLLLTVTAATPYWVIAAFSFVSGLGMGMSSTPMLVAVQSAVAWVRRGVATATNLFVRSFGQVVGLAVMGAIINSNASGYGARTTSRSLDLHARSSVPPHVLNAIRHALATGIHQTFIAALVAAIIGVLVVTFLPGGSARQHELREALPPSILEEAASD